MSTPAEIGGSHSRRLPLIAPQLFSAAVKAELAVGQQVAGAAPYPNLKSAETRLDKLTWLSVIESVASGLIVTSDPACDIACVSAA